MQKSTIFNGLSVSEASKIIRFIGGKKEKFNTTETLMSYNGNNTLVGVLLSGSAELLTYDYDGNRMMIDRYGKDALFGNIFLPVYGVDEPFVVASEPCEVLFFDYKKAMSEKTAACENYTLFLNNFISLLTDNLRSVTQHVEVLTKRSLREKLLAYFESLARQSGKNVFTLPFSLYSLADYLSMDRSAMQREMKRMREDGLILSKGRKIELCKRM